MAMEDVKRSNEILARLAVIKLVTLEAFAKEILIE